MKLHLKKNKQKEQLNSPELILPPAPPQPINTP